MNTQSYKTQSAKPQEVKRAWHIIDMEGKILGRTCTTITNLLRGKHKTSFTPHVDTGDYVIVINCDKARLTGKKMQDKQYVSYSGYPGGQKKRTPAQMLVKKPGFVVENAVKGMIPKNKLGSQIIKKLFLYPGTDHPHGAQNPQEYKV